MRRKYNKTKFRIVRGVNRWARNAFSPDPLKKWDERGVWGKGIKKVTGNVIAAPLRDASYASVGVLYNPKTDQPCKGSLLYTGFHWGYLLLMLMFPPVLLFFIIKGVMRMFKKEKKRGKNGDRY